LITRGIFIVNLSSVNEYGYIDKTGKYIIKPELYYACDFSEGLAYVEIAEISLDPDSPVGTSMAVGIGNCVSMPYPYIKYTIAWKPQYIDKTGRRILVPRSVNNVGDFSEGMAPVETNDKWGYIDKTGNQIIVPQFDVVGDFGEGLAPVETGNKWGYINKTGKYVVTAQFDDAEDFIEGLAPVRVGEKWGFINKTGSYVVAPQFDDARSFSESLAAVMTGDKWGYINNPLK
jgi:hypothetical protein